jgi:IS30 family transposase
VDLAIGKAGKAGKATLVERSSRYLVMLGLPGGKQAVGLADVLIEQVNDLPALMRGCLTWGKGTEIARDAQLAVAADLPVYFTHPTRRGNGAQTRTPTGRSVNTCPKGMEITGQQPYLDAIAIELNDQPRATLGYLTPREASYSMPLLLPPVDAMPDPERPTSHRHGPNSRTHCTLNPNPALSPRVHIPTRHLASVFSLPVSFLLIVQ